MLMHCLSACYCQNLLAIFNIYALQLCASIAYTSLIAIVQLLLETIIPCIGQNHHPLFSRYDAISRAQYLNYVCIISVEKDAIGTYVARLYSPPALPPLLAISRLLFL